MAKGKGFVYIMTTAVNGIIKIGQSKDWTVRCQEQLEENGYKNMNGLKTFFVVSVPDMDEYESTMHDIFRESRVISRKDNGKDTATELFAVDKNRAKRVLEKMGIEVFPVDRRKENAVKIKKEEVTTSPIVKSKQLTFEMLDIPIESELIFVGNKSKPFNLVVKTIDKTNKIIYQDKKYTLSGFATEKLGGPQQGGKYFTYNGELLTDIRKRLNK